MIGLLEGQIYLVTEEVLYLMVQGVGYEILSSKTNLENWSSGRGQKTQVWIYTHVREDGITLFGFQSLEEKMFFLSLLKVNGVGPKLALNIISGGSLHAVTQMIESGDAKALSQIPKVGKKTAEQMILTLKGKLVSIEADGNMKGQRHQEAISALINLGFRAPQVEEFVASLTDQIPTEDAVREGLRVLTQIPQKK